MRNGFYQEIFIPHDFGEANAYVVDTGMENLKNWLENKGFSKNFLVKIQEYKRACIIQNIFVDEEYRGKGIGTAILEELLAEAEYLGADVIILEADTGEENAFDLVSWYKNYDFNIIERENAYPLMMKVLD